MVMRIASHPVTGPLENELPLCQLKSPEKKVC